MHKFVEYKLKRICIISYLSNSDIYVADDKKTSQQQRIHVFCLPGLLSHPASLPWPPTLNQTLSVCPLFLVLNMRQIFPIGAAFLAKCVLAIRNTLIAFSSWLFMGLKWVLGTFQSNDMMILLLQHETEWEMFVVSRLTCLLWLGMSDMTMFRVFVAAYLWLYCNVKFLHK